MIRHPLQSSYKTHHGKLCLTSSLFALQWSKTRLKGGVRSWSGTETASLGLPSASGTRVASWAFGERLARETGRCSICLKSLGSSGVTSVGKLILSVETFPCPSTDGHPWQRPLTNLEKESQRIWIKSFRLAFLTPTLRMEENGRSEDRFQMYISISWMNPSLWNSFPKNPVK